MGVARLASVAGSSLLVHLDDDSAGARDGALPVLPAVPGRRDFTFFYSVPYSDWDSGRLHPHPVSNSQSRGTIRHRHCGADRGLCGCRCGADRRARTVQADAARISWPLVRTRVPADLQDGFPFPRRNGATAYVSADTSRGNRSLGVNVCDCAQPASRRTTRWRAHRVFDFTTLASSRVTTHCARPDSHGIFFWVGWFVWAILLSITGMRHPVVPTWPEIGPGRRWMALVALLMLALTLTPAPIQHS